MSPFENDFLKVALKVLLKEVKTDLMNLNTVEVSLENKHTLLSICQFCWNEWGWGFNAHLEGIDFTALLYITIWVRELDSSSK